jgi:hypothetical protein
MREVIVEQSDRFLLPGRVAVHLAHDGLGAGRRAED